MKSSLKQRGKANIVVMVIDADRADRFSCYGHYRKTTPNIDLLAEQGLIFEGAYTVDTASPLSHFALISGQSDWNGRAWLTKENWLGKMGFLVRRLLRRFRLTDYVGGYEHKRHALAMMLREQGYASIGISANQLVSPKTMKAYEGFDAFPEDELYEGLENDPLVEKRLKHFGLKDTKLNRLAVYLTADRVMRIAKKQIVRKSTNFEAPFFLFMNVMDCHDPYLSHPDYKEDFGFLANSSFNGDLRSRKGIQEANENSVADQSAWMQTDDLDSATIDLLRWNYDRSLGYVDQQIGFFVNWLEENQQMDNTVFFILSDHGEQLGEAGFFTHSQKPREFQMRIPLIVSGTKYINGTRRISYRVSIVDIRASIFDLIGVDDPFKHRSGESLFTERKDTFSAGDNQQSNPLADRSSQLMGGKREEVSEKELALMEERLRDLGYLD